MVNTFLKAVTKQLGTTFGTDYHYYVEDVSQNLIKPCFTVDMLIPLQRSKSAILYDRTMPLVVHYFSDSKTNLKNDSYGIAERLVECLEYVPFNSTIIRGEDISWQLLDGVLQVFVTYKFTTISVTNKEDAMEEFDETVTFNQQSE